VIGQVECFYPELYRLIFAYTECAREPHVDLNETRSPKSVLRLPVNEVSTPLDSENGLPVRSLTMPEICQSLARIRMSPLENCGVA